MANQDGPGRMVGPDCGCQVIAVLHGIRAALPRLLEVEALRVVSPPIILIVAVLGSILGGITNPTPAAALGAAGAIMLAATRRCQDDKRGSQVIIWAAIGMVIMAREFPGNTFRS